MSEQRETPQAEIKKAEMSLTPEQRVQSEARYQVLTHLDSWVEVGVSESKVQEAAEVASTKALNEYLELVSQNPWKTTTDIIKEAAEGLEPDERLLVEAHLDWNQNFPAKWKDKVEEYESYAKKGDKSTSTQDLVANIRWNNNSPSGYVLTENGIDYPGFSIASPKNKHLLDEGLSSKDPGGEKTITLSDDAVESIFQSFGSEVPKLGRQIEDKKLIETKLPGVFLSTSNGGENIAVNFSTASFEQIITTPSK